MIAKQPQGSSWLGLQFLLLYYSWATGSAWNNLWLTSEKEIRRLVITQSNHNLLQLWLGPGYRWATAKRKTCEDHSDAARRGVYQVCMKIE
jgi:hypothetical protein